MKQGTLNDNEGGLRGGEAKVKIIKKCHVRVLSPHEACYHCTGSMCTDKN